MEFSFLEGRKEGGRRLLELNALLQVAQRNHEKSPIFDLSRGPSIFVATDTTIIILSDEGADLAVPVVQDIDQADHVVSCRFAGFVAVVEIVRPARI